MEQFSLEKWLEDKSRKVVTRDGRPVRIICWDKKDNKYPIVGLVTNENGLMEKEGCCSFTINGKAWGEAYYDLFFADEEEEFTEFEKAVQNILNEPHFQDIEAVKQFSKTLLDLARKELEKNIEDGAIEFAKSYMDDVNPSFEKVQESEELWKWRMSCLRGINKAYTKGKEDALKDLPKWKKATEHLRGEGFIHYDKHNMTSQYADTNVEGGEYYLTLDDLKTLPKEE